MMFGFSQSKMKETISFYISKNTIPCWWKSISLLQNSNNLHKVLSLSSLIKFKFTYDILVEN